MWSIDKPYRLHDTLPTSDGHLKIHEFCSNLLFTIENGYGASDSFTLVITALYKMFRSLILCKWATNLEVIVSAGWLGPMRVGSLDVETQKGEGDGTALRLTNDVHAFLVVWIRVRIIRRRYVTGTVNVNSAASLATATVKTKNHYNLCCNLNKFPNVKCS